MFLGMQGDYIVTISESREELESIYDIAGLSSIEETDEPVERVDGVFVVGSENIINAKNEQIRKQRQARYVVESDPIRLDYDEALAREQDNAEQLKQDWLRSKDRIREELPYIVGEQDAT